MDLALNNLQRLTCHKTQAHKHANKRDRDFLFCFFNKIFIGDEEKFNEFVELC